MFNPDNWFWRTVARIGDLLGLSLCWLICSLPLFTAGTATAALYDAVAHCVRGEEQGTFVRFFRSLRGNFKSTLPITLIWIGVEVLLLWAFAVTRLMAIAGSQVAGVLVYTDLLFLCVPLAVWLMGVTAVSRFTIGGAALVPTALKLTLGHLPSAVLVTLITLAAGLLVSWLVVPIFLLPGVAALLSTLPLERVFRRYQNPTE